MIQTQEELGEELCNYCSCTNYGEHPSQMYTQNGIYFCEGCRCKEAYIDYLDSIGFNEEIAKYAFNVKRK